ncbi:MAG: 50S ribosomal protein L31e [Candidatus Woesearchaeota archaeon]
MVIERIYTINLRREFQKAPKYKYTSKAIRALKEFLKKHMKSDNVTIGKYLNQEIWKNGPKNPPAKVNIKVTKDEDKIYAELVGAPEEIKIEPKAKKVKPGNLKEKLEQAIKAKPKEEIKEPIKKDEVPKAEELAKKKEETKKKVTKKPEKVPTAAELKAKKKSK